MMKTIVGFIFATLALASFSFGKQKNLLETAKQAEGFTILAKAIEAAGLEGALTGDTELTVFAPTDEAFMRLPKGTLATLLKPENKDMLTNILTYHVVAGKVDGKTAVSLDEATALNKQKINVAFKDASLYLNDSKVIATDIKASNGVIHVIDNVLLPAQPEAKNMQATSQNPSLAIFTDAIDVGVDLFNDGDHRSCAKIYAMAVRAVVEMKSPKISQASMESLNNALKSIAGSADHGENAWTLRRAMDRAIRDLEN